MGLRRRTLRRCRQGSRSRLLTKDRGIERNKKPRPHQRTREKAAGASVTPRKHPQATRNCFLIRMQSCVGSLTVAGETVQSAERKIERDLDLSPLACWRLSRAVGIQADQAHSCKTLSIRPHSPQRVTLRKQNRELLATAMRSH